MQLTLEQKKKRYTFISHALALTDMALSLLFLTVLSFSPLSVMFRDMTATLGGGIVRFIAFAGLCFFFLYAAGLPFAFFSGYIIEKRFGLSNQNLLRWVWQSFKTLLVTLVIGLPLTLAFQAILRITGNHWWIWFALFLILFFTVVTTLSPVFILPLFHKVKPLRDHELAARISAFAASIGIRASSVCEFDLSRNTRKANAMFTGIGRTRKVILGDTLLEGYTHEEILSVFAHEAGHYTGKHILKGLFVSSALTALSLFACARLFPHACAVAGYTPYSLESLPLLVLLLSATGIIAMPLVNALSRAYERAADRFALKTTRDADSFISAMQKLSDMNLAAESGNPVYEFFFASHPSIASRIARAKRFIQDEK